MSYTFSWHCQREVSLWLDEGCGPEAVRKMQTHPWIDTSLFDESESEEDGKSTKSSPNRGGIVSWRNGVSRAKRARRQKESHSSFGSASPSLAYPNLNSMASLRDKLHQGH
jgi:hypothetical protein